MDTMAPLNSKQSKLFSNELLEELEERLEAGYKLILSRIGEHTEKVSHEFLIATVSQGLYEDVALGLLYGMLTNPTSASRYFRDLCVVSRDGFKYPLSVLNQIVTEKFLKLVDGPRNQLLWFIREAVKNDIPSMDTLCLCLMRNIIGGNRSDRNLYLADYMVDLYLDNKTWLYKTGNLQIPFVIYHFLRLLADHCGLQFTQLREKEIRLCIQLLRERFDDCAVVGRDLTRLLIGVARIPEFEEVWRDLLFNPKGLGPSCPSILSILNARTPKRFIISRISFDLEKKVFYLLNNVKFANSKRVYDTIQSQFLPPSDYQSLHADVVRYVCAVIHPTNELLASDVTPRWNFVGWLLGNVYSSLHSGSCKLALFYDWLCFDYEKGNIMDVEPAILLMHNSVRSQPAMANSLLDFLCRTMNEFANGMPMIADRIKAGVMNSLTQILEKKVVSSLSQLFGSARLDREVRMMLAESFPEFMTESKSDPLNGSEPSTSVDVENVENDEVVSIPTEGNGFVESEFSDEEASESGEGKDDSNGPGRKNGRKGNPGENGGDFLAPTITSTIEELKLAEGTYNQCDVLQKLLLAILHEDLSEEQASLVAEQLCDFFGNDYFTQVIFPNDPADIGALEDSLQRPVNVLFRNLCLLPESDPTYERLIILLSLIYDRQPRLGYHFLYFLRASQVLKQDVKTSHYTELCKSSGISLDEALLRDLTLCQQDDYRMFGYLIPEVYSKFSSVALSSVKLMHLIVGTVDSVQMQDLVALITQGTIHFFRKDSFMQIINASLEWETIEQYFLWQLIAAENILTDWVIPVISKLEYPDHSEAMTNVLLLLRRLDTSVTTPLVRALMSRPLGHQNDLFTCSALKLLFETDEDRLAEVVSTILNKSLVWEQHSAKSNSKKPISRGPMVDQVLGHLDVLRQHWSQSQNFFLKEMVQTGLKEAQRSSSESVKKKYSELFSIMEVLDSVRSGRSLRRGRKIEPTPAEDSESSDEEQRDKPVRKRKKVAAESDSD